MGALLSRALPGPGQLYNGAVGKARQVWFSKGKDGVRWGRLGKVLE